MQAMCQHRFSGSLLWRAISCWYGHQFWAVDSESLWRCHTHHSAQGQQGAWHSGQGLTPLMRALTFFLCWMILSSLTSGETRCSFPPEIAAVGAGSRAATLSCCAQRGCHGVAVLLPALGSWHFWVFGKPQLLLPEPASSFPSFPIPVPPLGFTKMCGVSGLEWCWTTSPSGLPKALLPQDSWLALWGFLLGSPKVCPAAMKTVGNLGFSFLFYGRLYRLFISSFWGTNEGLL